MKRTFTILFVLFGVSAFAVDHNVSIINFAFSPADITIEVGDRVIWTHNAGGTSHTTTSGTGCGGADGIWNSGTMTNGQTFDFTFNTVGVYDYFCLPHCGGMQGSITVEDPLGTQVRSAEEIGFEVYPNPSEDLVNIKTNLGQGSQAEIQLLSSKGEILSSSVKTLPSGANVVQLDLTEQPAGIYHIKVILNERRFYLKKVVKK